jgi:protein-S-isoprenylcysteine O-methyltransferase Ste14
MLTQFVDRLVEISAKPRSAWSKVAATAIGLAIFLFVLPAILFPLGYLVEKYILPNQIRIAEFVFSVACIVVGIFFLIWSIYVLIREGQGTPSPVAPTQKLITTGPYRLCRNPIQLGAMFYCLGIGTLLGSIWIGLIMMFLSYKIIGAYDRNVEEKELEIRFGDEYKEYKKRTPFLLPRFRADSD